VRIISISTEVKNRFIADFQKKIVQGRRLLQGANHRWADKLFTDLYYDIEKTDWLDDQKKRQFTMIISNSWWMYINSLVRREDDGRANIDIIRYIDAYKRFFSFLSKLDDFYLFNNFCTNLLRTFIKMEDLSPHGITKFINSYSNKLKDKGENLKLIELQILLMYLRKSVIPSELFHFGMKVLGQTIFELEPGKRALFLYIFIENVNIQFQFMEDPREFVQIIQKLLVGRLSTYLKGVFADLSKININERNFNVILKDLEELIYYLNNIGQSSWTIIIVRNLYSKFQEFQSFGDAVDYIRRFINFALTRNRFEIAFEIYDFMEDIFMYQTDLGYDNILIELWVQACKNFVDMKNKKYLLQSLEKLSNHLKLPSKTAQVYHFFYTFNYLWKYKGSLFSLEKKDFWRMMFYRALFEEKDLNLAQKIMTQLDKNLAACITDLDSLYSLGDSLKHEIYSFEEEEADWVLEDKDFNIIQMILRINSEGKISYRLISADYRLAEGIVQNDHWNDTHIMELYNDLFSEQQEKIYNFNLNEFGRLLYIFLPKKIRQLFNKFKIVSLNIVPQIYFILDRMTIPFELIFDSNNFFLLKYSSSYKIGEAPLVGIGFEQIGQDELLTAPSEELYNILIIDAINSTGPLKWNEDLKKKELIFPFPDGANELDFITNFFNSRNEVNQINLLSGMNSTRENILLNLSQGAYHIIHFVGNIFYSEGSPPDSFFLTNDNNIVTFREIYLSLIQNQARLKPFLFFNTQIYDVDGNKLKNTLQTFGEIVSNFNYEEITGIVSQNYPIFNNETKDIIANFYINLFKKHGQGVALLKARQQRIAKITMVMAEQQESQNLGLESSLAISSYVLFGRPWKKL